MTSPPPHGDHPPTDPGAAPPARASGAAGSLTLADAAAELGVHYMTAYRYVRTGLLEARQERGQWRVEPRALAELRTRRAGTPGRRGRQRAGSSRRAADRRADALADRLVAGDEAGAWRLVEDSLAAGWSSRDVYLSLMGTALSRVGDRWADGSITVADEHGASVVAMRLLGRLGARTGRPGRTRGSVLLSAPPGDRHALPTAMVADLLRAEGFRVVDLGADTPGEYLAAAAAAEDRLLGVGICATSPLDRAGERRLRDAIRWVHERADRPVLLGGAAIAGADTAQRLGADHWSRDAADVLAWCAARSTTTTGPASGARS